MSFTFCMADGDARQQAAGRALREAGCIRGAPEHADFLLLPMPLRTVTPGQLDLLHRARPDTPVFAGLITPQARSVIQRAGRVPVDYYTRSELASLNAVPTAEGCLCLLMQMRTRTLWESPVLVLGFGRVGQAVARRLAALGARVTVAARNAEQRAGARCCGCHAAPLTALERLLPDFDAVVNTIPAMVLPAELLGRLPRGAVVIDLASAPGGVDFDAAQAMGLQARLASGLPGRCAPDTAGELIAQTILNILNEQGRATV
nr:NAD(P)-dependent oxidoreductase [uncultured Gemmiger sp.]